MGRSSKLENWYFLASIVALILLGFYFYMTSSSVPPRFSNIQLPDSACPSDFISQVKCLSTTTGVKQPTLHQLQQIQGANNAYNKGTALARSGKILDAIKYYDKALSIQPTNSYLLMSKGDALSSIGNYTDAIKYYDKALTIEPDNISSTGVIINKANDLYRLGRYEEAIKSYHNALVGQPSDPNLLINTGNALFHMTNYSGAIKYYDKALALLQNNDKVRTSVIINKASSLFRLGNYIDAIKYYDKALTMIPNDVELRKDKLEAVRALHTSMKSGTR